MALGLPRDAESQNISPADQQRRSRVPQDLRRHKISDRKPTVAADDALTTWMANTHNGDCTLARGSLHRFHEKAFKLKMKFISLLC